MKRKLTVLIMAVVLTVGLSSGAASAQTCTTNWGSLAKTAPPNSSATHYVTNVRTGRHACFDRMVIDVDATGGTGFFVQYVDKLYSDPVGDQIAMTKSGAILQVVTYAINHDDDYNLTYPAKTGLPLPGVNVTGYTTFREAKFAGSFEDTTTIGLGVRARLPFTVFKNGSDVVIDVAHKW